VVVISGWRHAWWHGGEDLPDMIVTCEIDEVIVYGWIMFEQETGVEVRRDMRCPAQGCCRLARLSRDVCGQL
jgi:hypothetical protein